MIGLQGKVALVTGAGGERGAGRVIATRLAAEGADVVVTDIAPAGTRILADTPQTGWRGLEAVADEIRATGRRALPLLVDIRSADQVQRAVDRVLAEWGRLDILVNNAAAPPGADRVPVVDLSEAAWEAVLRVNLTGTFLVSRAAARAMLRQGIRGRIITILSNRAKEGAAHVAAYTASKFGLLGFTQCLALELAAAGITVNAVCPISIDSERLDYLGQREDGRYEEAVRAENIRRRAATVPVGRLATPRDVAAAVVFLASDDAEFITGESINVAGGALLC